MTTAFASADRREPPTPVQQRSIRGRGADLLLNVTVLAVLWVAYSAVRSVTASEFSTAMGNAATLLHFENVIGLPSEVRFQRNLLDRIGLLKAANVYYVAVHFPATIGFLAWVWLRHRDRFNRIRNTLVGVTVVGLVLHIAYPLAPPRMINGFVDTAAVLGPNPYEMRLSGTANQIAAMPSLHVGWALLVALGIMWIVKSRWSVVALLHPIITAGVVVVTANHYWIDAIVAVAIVTIGWLICRGHRPGWTKVLPPDDTGSTAGADERKQLVSSQDATVSS